MGDASPQDEPQSQIAGNANTHKRRHSGSFGLMRPETVDDRPEQEPQNQCMPFLRQGFANGGQQMAQTIAQPAAMGHAYLKSHQGAAPNGKIDHAGFFPGLSASSMDTDPTVPLRLDTSTTSKIGLTGATLEPSKDPQKLNQLFSGATSAKKNAPETAKKRKNPDEVPIGRTRVDEEAFKKLNREYNARIAKYSSTSAGTPSNNVSDPASCSSGAGLKHSAAAMLVQQTESTPSPSTVTCQSKGPVASAATVANAVKNMDPTTKRLIDCAFYLGTFTGTRDAIRTYHCRLVDSVKTSMGDLTVRAFLGIPMEVMEFADDDSRKQEAVAKSVEKAEKYHFSRMKRQSPDSALCTRKIRPQDTAKLVGLVPEFFAKTQRESRRTSSDLGRGLTRSPSTATAVVAERKTPSPGPGCGRGVPTTDGSGSAPRVLNGDAFQGQMEMAMNGQSQAQPGLSPTMGRGAQVIRTMPGQQGIQSIISGPNLTRQADGAAGDTAGNGNTPGIDVPAAQAQTPRSGENGASGGSSPFQINGGRAHVDQDALKTQTKGTDVEAPKPGRGRKRSASKASHAEEQEIGSMPKRKRAYKKKKDATSTSSTTVEKETTLSPGSDAALSNDTGGISADTNTMGTEDATSSSSSMTAHDAERDETAPPKRFNTWLKSLAVPRPPRSENECAEIHAMLAGFGIDAKADFIDAKESSDSTDIDAL